MKKISRLVIGVASAAFFVAPALAQNSGSVTNHAFAIGKGPGTTGYASVLCATTQIPVGQTSADPICRTVSGDVTINASGVTAIGTNKVVNSMLATMAANTTKCNATAGTAAPTDCDGSTMRTNLGLVIGTNVQAFDSDLSALAANSTNGLWAITGSGTGSARTLTAGSGITVTNGNGVSGNPTVAISAPVTVALGGTNCISASGTCLDNITGFAGTGFIGRAGAGSYTARTITAGSGITVTNGDGISGNPTVAITAPVPVALGGTNCTSPSGTCLDNITGFGTTGLTTRTGVGTYLARTVTAGTGITVANGDGVSGNPTVAITNQVAAGGPTGSGTAIPVITYNAQGQITAVSTATPTVLTSGTWTPAITTDGTVGTPAYTTQAGFYKKITSTSGPSLVQVSFAITLSGWTGSPTGNISISGLPFTATATSTNNGGCSFNSYTVAGLAANNYGIVGFISPSTAVINPRSSGNTGVSTVTAAQAGSTASLFGFCNYATDS